MALTAAAASPSTTASAVAAVSTVVQPRSLSQPTSATSGLGFWRFLGDGLASHKGTVAGEALAGIAAATTNSVAVATTAAAVATLVIASRRRSRRARANPRCFTQVTRLVGSEAVSAATDNVGAEAPAGLLLIEHLNLNVLSTEVSLRFYEALGCARDERRPMSKTLHNNCGALTQFHTPSPTNEAYIGSTGAQRWRGDIELLYRDAAGVRAAAESVGELRGQEGFLNSRLNSRSLGDVDGEPVVAVTGPYGNAFTLRVAEPSRCAALAPVDGARPGSDRSWCVGLGAVTLRIPPGTAAPGARFYAEVFGFRTEELAGGCSWAVVGGPAGAQRLILEEHADATGEELGEHVAIYIGDFAGCFERLRSRELIFVNPRFAHLDSSTTLEEAYHFSCFRFKDIVDPATGAKLFQLEHEVRNTAHKSCPPALRAEE